MNNIPQTPEAYRAWWVDRRPDIPYGLCWCGCGQETRLHPNNRREKYETRGEPRRFLHGHTRAKQPVAPEPYEVKNCGFVTPCWMWQRAQRYGYGHMWHRGRNGLAHRFYYIDKYGLVPEGLELDHLCMNPLCVNPEHLEPVTHTENVRRSKHRKLTQAKADRIRWLHQNTELALDDLAAMYGITRGHVSRVINRRAWS